MATAIISVIISLIVTFIVGGYIIHLCYKAERNQLPEKIKGEKFSVEAMIEHSWSGMQPSFATVRMVVKYVIENKEYENDVSLKANPVALDCFKRGNKITIVVDKKDYNNISIDTTWLYNSGAMTQREYLLRKHKKQL